MGGNALKNTIIERIEFSLYNSIKNDIFNKLKAFAEIKFIKDAPNKLDFGDIDILYKTELDLKSKILEIFCPVETFTNSNIFSFAYNLNGKYYQIDMIQTTDFEMYEFYYSYGDVGNIIGRMVRESGLRLGCQGLFLKNDILEKETIILSNNPTQICEYLGIEHSKWGFFEDENEIFEWIISSRFFVNEFHCRSKDKRKQRTRQMLKNYLNFIVDKPSNTVENKQSEALSYFGKNEIYNNIIHEKELLDYRKKKFNGCKFMNFGIQGKSVGGKIEEFKKHIKTVNNTIDDNFFEKWLDINDEAFIDTCIKQFMNK